MTMKSSISLTDAQYEFAKTLVREGRYASVSSVLQHGVELLRKQEEDAALERAALKQLLTERAEGPFVPLSDARGWLSGIKAERRGD